MNKFTIKQATKQDTALLRGLILGLATYEKRPQDMTASTDNLNYWLFERKIATALIAYLDKKPVGYAIYYPVFGSFAAKGKVHLEDVYIIQEQRKKGLGKIFLAEIIKRIQSEGYTGMEWSCLDWNAPAIKFYDKVGAEKESGRVYFDFNEKQMDIFLASQIK